MDHHSDTPQPPSAGATPVAKPGVSQRRRRFIQAGVVPVGLTLASRPVMAWHCNTTSAWGSAILRNGGASVRARAELAVIRDTECWTVANWKDNTSRSQVRNGTQPWVYASQRWCNGTTFDKAKKQLTVGMVLPKGLWNTDSRLKVWDLLNSNQNSYASWMLCARLNTLFAGNKVAQCVVAADGTDMLEQMARLGPGQFKPKNSVAAWSDQEIRRYLSENWLVA